MTPIRKNRSPASPSRDGKKKDLEELLAIMARLRGPGGCPWDRRQTAHTLKRHLLEEAYEVLEAIEAGTSGELKEELGDLLLQILFQARIAEERGRFAFADVARSLREKLIRRHPHVFASGRRRPKPKTAGEVVQVWESAKEAEKGGKGRTSLLEGLPLSLPALERAQKISERVSRAGFDWPNPAAVWEKVKEELSELEEAARGTSRREVEAELGDLFFTLVNWARLRGLSAEEALRRANRRFARRFRHVEKGLRRRGSSVFEASLEEMEHLWEEAKGKPRRP
ncbi:MAG: nucleoside triphosphate pyrophosphohydrolase [Deltaproteobacteria bacterium]|nr:nucleoside triphosphate pyrophosphohydrolase [Deltaproteobacteria bacterium]